LSSDHSLPIVKGSISLLYRHIVPVISNAPTSLGKTWQ